jgi:hypothetical protein
MDQNGKKFWDFLGLYKKKEDKSRPKILPLFPHPLSNILPLSKFIIQNHQGGKKWLKNP